MERDGQQVRPAFNPFGSLQERAWEASRPAPWSSPDPATDPTVRFFWVLLLAHVVLWTVIPAVTQPNLPLETVKLLAWGSDLQWGYYETPPLPAWMAYATCALLGKASWPAYLLAQICTATCLWAAWRMAREFLHPWTAICAAFALEGCIYYTFAAHELNAGVFSRCWWALAVMTFYWSMVGNRRVHWLATGVFLALGLLSRYDTLLLVGAMVLFTIWNERARQCWDSSRPILGMMLSSAILLPHVLWLFQHDFVTIKAMLDSTSGGGAADHIANPLKFGLAQLGAFLPVAILLTPLIRFVELDEAHEVEADHEFLRRYLVWVTVLPFAVMIAGSLFSGARLTAVWGGTLWTFAGVSLLLWSKLEERRLGWRRSVLMAGAVVGAFAAALVVHNQMLPGLRQKASRIHFPGVALAQSVETTWKARFPDKPLKAVGGPAWLAANASWYGSDSPTVYAELDAARNPGRDDKSFAKDGAMIVWDDAAEDAAAWAQLVQSKFGDRVQFVPQPKVLNYQTKASNVGNVRVAMAIVSPLATAATPQAGLLSAPESVIPGQVIPGQVIPGQVLPQASTIPQANGLVSPVPAARQYEPTTPYRNAYNANPDRNAVTPVSGQSLVPQQQQPTYRSTIPQSAAQQPANSATRNMSTIPQSTIPGSLQPVSQQPRLPETRSTIPQGARLPDQATLPAANGQRSTIPDGAAQFQPTAAPRTSTIPPALPTRNLPQYQGLPRDVNE